MDHQQKELFKIQFLDRTDTRGIKEFDSVVMFPVNIGITAVAIDTDKTIYFNEGHKMPQFLNEVDNCNGALFVDSLIVAPIRTSEGELWGVL